MNVLRLTAFVSLLVVALASSACFTFRATMPGAVRNDIDEEELEDVGTLDEDFTHTYFVHGAFGAPAEDILKKRMLQAAAEAGADGVRNLDVEARFTWTGIAITLLTASMVHPRRYRVTGTLVRIAAPALPSSTAPSESSEQLPEAESASARQ